MNITDSMTCAILIQIISYEKKALWHIAYTHTTKLNECMLVLWAFMINPKYRKRKVKQKTLYELSLYTLCQW